MNAWHYPDLIPYSLPFPLSGYRVKYTRLTRVSIRKYSKGHHNHAIEGRQELPYANIPSGKTQGKEGWTRIQIFYSLLHSLIPVNSSLTRKMEAVTLTTWLWLLMQIRPNVAGTRSTVSKSRWGDPSLWELLPILSQSKNHKDRRVRDLPI